MKKYHRPCHLDARAYTFWRCGIFLIAFLIVVALGRHFCRHYQKESYNPVTQDNLWCLTRCRPLHQDPRPVARHPLVLVNPHPTSPFQLSSFCSFSPQILLLERPNSRNQQLITHPAPGTYFHQRQGSPFLAKECSKSWSGIEDLGDAF